MWKRLLIPVLSLALLWFSITLMSILPFPQNKTMANTTVTLVSKSVVKPGENFNVDIMITPVSGANVAGAQLNLAFNPKAVKVNSVVEGNFLKVGGSTFFMSGTIDNVAGTVVNVAAAIIVPNASVNTPGVFVTFNCTALTAGSVSFVLSNVIVGSKDAVAIPLDSSIIPPVAVAFPWDVNLDGKINQTDMALVYTVFGQMGTPGWRREDVNGDGSIDILDMILVGQEWSA